MGENLKNFVEEAKKVSDYYWTFAEEADKVEGPDSIIGMEFWDGGDDIDYVNSAILGFKEYGEVCKNKEDYFENLLTSKALTDNSQKDWSDKLNNLAELFGKLSDEERKNLWKEFPDYFDEDPDSEEEDDYGEDDDYDMEDAEEAVGQSGGVTPEIEKAAYEWVDHCFADEDSDLYDEEGNFNFEEYDQRKETSGYPMDLLNWIDSCLQQMDDVGYEYPVFVSIFGHYPGEGNWKPYVEGETDPEEYYADEFDPEDDIEKEIFESLIKNNTNNNLDLENLNYVLEGLSNGEEVMETVIDCHYSDGDNQFWFITKLADGFEEFDLLESLEINSWGKYKDLDDEIFNIVHSRKRYLPETIIDKIAKIMEVNWKNGKSLVGEDEDLFIPLNDKKSFDLVIGAFKGNFSTYLDRSEFRRGY